MRKTGPHGSGQPSRWPPSLIEQETSAAVRAALDELPDNQRMAVVLRYYEALDYRSIGETLEISPKAVERLLARARMRLGVLLKT